VIGWLTRRRATAALTVYASSALAILGALAALRILGPTDAGRLAIVLGAVDFISSVLWLTSDEALVKYGFRYTAQQDWGRFHRLVRLTFTLEVLASFAGALLIVAIAPYVDSIFSGADGLETAMLVAALLPGMQAVESIGDTLVILRGRYDLRGMLLAYSMGLRLVGLVVGAQHGVTAAVVGVVAAQALGTATVFAVGLLALRRFPAAAPVRLGEDRGPIVRFVLQSSLYTGLVSVRTWIAPLVLGMVRTATDVGLFRAAQAPQHGFAVLISPVHLILLTDQTRDWERGKPAAVLAGVRRYVAGSTLLAAVVLPPAIWLMPWLVTFVLGDDYAPAVDAARIVLVAAAIYLVFGWTKSFPVTIGRPGLRLVAHGVESAVLLPLLVVLGREWGVTGAGVAVLVSAFAFALTWVVLVAWLRRTGFEPKRERPQPAAVTAPR
jgi:O-antigen/teichoic acid export membrane protein